MLQFFGKYRKFFFVMLFLSAVIVFLFYTALKPRPSLPVYQPNMVNAELVDEDLQFKRKYHTIAPFRLVNQNGDTITEATYNEKIYIADFFFTTCPTICPVMSNNLEQVQAVFEDVPELMILSHSVTPEADSIAPPSAWG